MNVQGNRACDECRSRKIKCKATSTSCEACDKKQMKCVFASPVRKRGPKRLERSSERFQDSFATKDLALSGITIIPPVARVGLPPVNQSVAQPGGQLPQKAETSVPLPKENEGETPVPTPTTNFTSVKSDEYGSLNIVVDSKGRKMAHYYIFITDGAIGSHYSPVSSTSLVNHPLSFLDADSCQTWQVLGLLTSQQIYITIIFFTHVYPHYPSIDVADFNNQLKLPMTTSLLFLLNCICAVACPYGSNSKARFDKTQFYYKALEINYYTEEPQINSNWAYGHLLLKLSKQSESNDD